MQYDKAGVQLINGCNNSLSADELTFSALVVQVCGQVQGVGFRPFVYNLAQRLGLNGSVCNRADGVLIRVQGDKPQLDLFQRLLEDEKPPMALIDSLIFDVAEPDVTCAGFSILDSVAGEVKVSVTPDASVCSDCLAELFDTADRRYRYPFINCTNCGPRYTLIKQLPYDRSDTTMSEFELCHSCQQEYDSPADRRFHAQPNACSNCGPELVFHDAAGVVLESFDPLLSVIELIRAGDIIAIKGIGGFHLVCDACNPEAVARLRQRKQRPDKPFAVMAANLPSLTGLVDLNAATGQRLQAQDAPVVLCPFTRDSKQEKQSAELQGIAPGLNWCGVMLPHSPLHYLLFHTAAGEPAGSEWLGQKQNLLLVMTSGNRSGDPLVTDNAEALKQLAGIADGFLMHNRDIHIRCDDSVVSGLSETMPLIRRGRGLAPQVIELPQSGPSVLACGAFFKNTVCLTKGNKAYVSQYIGDLANPECCRSLHKTIEHLQRLLDIEPELVACDLHPDFFSTRLAQEYCDAKDIPLLQVQHHHAHIAAVMAEHKITGPAIGLALDGLGLGSDGRLWGGELLKVSATGFDQLGQLSALPLPGGDRAAREPWRVAAGILYRLDRVDEISARFSACSASETVQQMLAKDLNCPLTSSAGRLFDGISALLGICLDNSFEAQAAMQLESHAYQYLQHHDWPDEPSLIQTAAELEMLPLLRRISEIDDPGYGAALFHQQLISGLSDWAAQVCVSQQVNQVVLAGGCFLNQLLRQGIEQQLTALGIEVFCAVQLPCNDSGISLGQAQVAHFVAHLKADQQSDGGPVAAHQEKKHVFSNSGTD
ncbi:carbamoyltransferase HypF [Amphritea sp. HPY]|uniref:carbamoyltransferase HypF n=1 Tax=Amphritea sp. HPY TaxID=3421652 RepID=UPI003D7EA30F